MNSSLGCVLFESLLVFHKLILPLLLLLHLLPLFHLVLCHESCLVAAIASSAGITYPRLRLQSRMNDKILLWMVYCHWYNVFVMRSQLLKTTTSFNSFIFFSPLSFSFFICVQDFALEKTIKYTMENEPARSLAFVQGLLLALCCFTWNLFEQTVGQPSYQVLLILQSRAESFGCTNWLWGHVFFKD